MHLILAYKICTYTTYHNRLFDCQVIYAGDSAADEIAIERLKGVAYTFRVINEDADVITKTAADYRLAGKNGISLLIPTDTELNIFQLEYSILTIH